MGRSSNETNETMGHFPSEERCLFSRYQPAGCNSIPSLLPTPLTGLMRLPGSVKVLNTALAEVVQLNNCCASRCHQRNTYLPQ